MPKIGFVDNRRPKVDLVCQTVELGVFRTKKIIYEIR